MAGRRAGRGTRVHGTHAGRVGEPSRGIHGVADDRVLQRRLHAGDHVAGVDSDPQPGRCAATAFVVEHPAYRSLHGQGRPDRPFGVVLVCDRSAEHGHDAVAGQLVDVATEGLYRARQARRAPGR